MQVLNIYTAHKLARRELEASNIQLKRDCTDKLTTISMLRPITLTRHPVFLGTPQCTIMIPSFSWQSIRLLIINVANSKLHHAAPIRLHF